MDYIPYLDESLSFEERAKDLVSRMTLEEKCEQTKYDAPAIPRLKVKSYNYWNEALHGVARAGVATVFPQAIALAATFDEDLVCCVACAISDEARGKFNMQQNENDTDIYKGLTFWSPNVNIFRDPRWGRGQETYGEDPYLTSRIGVSFVKGLQSCDGHYLKAAACVKHYAVHSGPESKRHYFNAEVNKKDLFETYLPAFKACVLEAGVEAVMGAYNRTNGEPCCGSKTLIVDILRGDWGFKGHFVSDCWALADFHEHHHITSNAVESAALAMNNGCDVNCGVTYLNLMIAYNEGLVSEEAITAAVIRLMTTRMRLGMFDASQNVSFNNIKYTVVDSKENRALNLEVSKKSLVLLKNKKNLLPLNLEKVHTLGVIGPNADNRKALVGNYEGTSSRYVTPLEGIEDFVGDKARVIYSEGSNLFKDRQEDLSINSKNDRLSEAKAVAKESDVVILFLGLDASLEGEEFDTGNSYGSGDKVDLNLPGMQQELLEEIIQIGKPVVIVTIAGSALAIDVDNKADALIYAFYPGAQGGNALAQLLFGEFSPEGKLPITLYKSATELPDFEDYSMENRTYRYMKNDALYPFGFGLSYTNFELSDLTCDDYISEDSEFKLEVDIKNTGKMRGSEVIEVYVKVNTVGAPNYSLKNFKKICLEPNEKKVVKFCLPADSFKLANDDGEFVLNNCSYEIFVGTSQPDEVSIKLLGYKPLNKTVKVK